MPNVPQGIQDNIDRAFESFPVADQETALMRLDYLTLARKMFDRKLVSITPGGFKRISRIGAWQRRRQIADLEGKSSLTMELENYSGETLKNWWRRWRKGGFELNALLPEHRSKGAQIDDTMTTEVAIVVADYIRKYYLTFEAVPLSVVIEAIEAELTRQNNDENASHVIPSESTIRRWKARNISDFEETWHREGKKVAEQKYRNVKIAPRATRPLERVQIDHTKLDILLVAGYKTDKQGKKKPVLKRPWLTLAICEATRLFVGFHISFEHPSWSSVMACLRMLVLPKEPLLEGLDIASPWPIFGVPELLIVDNGKEFHSNSLKAAAGHLGFEIRWAPRYKGKLKGKVERGNGEVARNFLAFLPGKTFSSVHERGDYPAEKRAAVSIEELIEQFTIWTCDYVHNREHSGMMMQTPLRRLEAVKGFGVKLPSEPEQLDALLGLVVNRTIQPKGIEHLGLWYQMPGLTLLKKRPGHLGKSWMVKMDPCDLNQIMILDELKGKWVIVPSADEELTKGLTLAQWHQICLKAKENTSKNRAITRDILLKTRLRLLEMGSELGAGKKTRITQTDIDWANQYQSQDGPKVLNNKAAKQAPVDERRHANREQPAASKGKVSERTGTKLPKVGAPPIQTTIPDEAETEGSEARSGKNFNEIEEFENDPDNWS